MSLQSALALHGLWWLCFRSVTSKAHFLPIDENQFEWMRLLPCMVIRGRSANAVHCNIIYT